VAPFLAGGACPEAKSCQAEEPYREEEAVVAEPFQVGIHYCTVLPDAARGAKGEEGPTWCFEVVVVETEKEREEYLRILIRDVSLRLLTYCLCSCPLLPLSLITISSPIYLHPKSSSLQKSLDKDELPTLQIQWW